MRINYMNDEHDAWELFCGKNCQGKDGKAHDMMFGCAKIIFAVLLIVVIRQQRVV